MENGLNPSYFTPDFFPMWTPIQRFAFLVATGQTVISTMRQHSASSAFSETSSRYLVLIENYDKWGEASTERINTSAKSCEKETASQKRCFSRWPPIDPIGWNANPTVSRSWRWSRESWENRSQRDQEGAPYRFHRISATAGVRYANFVTNLLTLSIMGIDCDAISTKWESPFMK